MAPIDLSSIHVAGLVSNVYEFVDELGRLFQLFSFSAYWSDRPYLVKYALISQHCNLWRNEADITSTWSSIFSIISTYVRKQNELVGWSGPGRFHDPDMVLILF